MHQLKCVHACKCTITMHAAASGLLFRGIHMCAGITYLDIILLFDCRKLSQNSLHTRMYIDKVLYATTQVYAGRICSLLLFSRCYYVCYSWLV